MQKNKDNLNYIIISAIFLIAVSQWLRMNDFMPAHTGDTRFIALSYDYYHLIHNDFKNLFDYALSIHSSKPPLIIYFFTLIIFLFNGANQHLVYLTGILALNIFFLVNLFYFFKYVFKDSERVRNITLILYMVSPLLFALTKISYVELLLLNFIILTWTLIKKWEGKLTFKRTFLLGLVIGFGFLVKSTFFIYTVLPLFYLAIKKFRTIRDELKNTRLIKSALEDKESTKSKRYISLEIFKYLLLFSAGASIALPWYLKNFDRVFGLFNKAANYTMHSDGKVWSLATLEHYGLDMIQAFGFFSFIAFIVLLILRFDDMGEILRLSHIKDILKKPIDTILKHYVLCFSLMPIVTFAAFFFVENKNERFQFLALFLFAVLLAFMNRKIDEGDMSYRIFLSLVALQALFTVQLSFTKLLPKIQDTTVMYVSRPYPKLFIPELKEKLDLRVNLEQVNFIDLRKQEKKDKIYSNDNRSVITSSVKFALFKAQNGLLAKQDHKVRSTYRMAETDIMKSRKDYVLVLYDKSQSPRYQLNFRPNPEKVKAIIDKNTLKSLKPITYYMDAIIELENDSKHSWVLYKKGFAQRKAVQSRKKKKRRFGLF